MVGLWHSLAIVSDLEDEQVSFDFNANLNLKRAFGDSIPDGVLDKVDH